MTEKEIILTILEKIMLLEKDMRLMRMELEFYSKKVKEVPLER
jgi:hypothetical protein